MTYKEVLTLLAAGYTKAEISQMDDISPAAPTAGDDKPQASILSPAAPAGDPPDQQSSSETSQPIQPAEGTVPAPQSAGEGAGDQIAQLQQMISALITEVQNGNRDNAEMGARIIDPHASAIDTLRSISSIPTKKEE